MLEFNVNHALSRENPKDQPGLWLTLFGSPARINAFVQHSMLFPTMDHDMCFSARRKRYDGEIENAQLLSDLLPTD